MSLIIFRLTSLVVEIVCILLYPVLFLFLKTKNYQAALNYKATNSEKGILIHAASVGEVNAVKPLLSALEELNKTGKIVLTTTTKTGLKLAQSLTKTAHLSVLDLPILRAKQLKAIDPRLIIIVETEIWPNLLDQAKRQGRDVVFVNARMSEKTFGRYRRLKSLLRHLQEPVKMILAQSDKDAQRFRQIFSFQVKTAGNLKYSLKLPSFDAFATRGKYGYKETDFIVCLGSSRPGEEELFKDILPRLKIRIPNLKIVMAPRHLKRLNDIQAMFPEHTIFSNAERENPVKDIFLIDTIGYLPEFYSICDVAVVGGSFYDFGGHNPLEPAFYAKPVVMGPFYASCSGSVRALQDHAGILITEINELPEIIIDLYVNPDKRELLGKNALQCVKRNSDSLENHLGGLKPWLKQ